MPHAFCYCQAYTNLIHFVFDAQLKFQFGCVFCFNLSVQPHFRCNFLYKFIVARSIRFCFILAELLEIVNLFFAVYRLC